MGRVQLLVRKNNQFNVSKYIIATHKRRIPGRLLRRRRVYVQANRLPTPMQKPVNLGRNMLAVVAGVLAPMENTLHPQRLCPEDQSADSIAAAVPERGLQKILVL